MMPKEGLRKLNCIYIGKWPPPQRGPKLFDLLQSGVQKCLTTHAGCHPIPYLMNSSLIIGRCTSLIFTVLFQVKILNVWTRPFLPLWIVLLKQVAALFIDKKVETCWCCSLQETWPQSLIYPFQTFLICYFAQAVHNTAI